MNSDSYSTASPTQKYPIKAATWQPPLLNIPHNFNKIDHHHQHNEPSREDPGTGPNIIDGGPEASGGAAGRPRAAVPLQDVRSGGRSGAGPWSSPGGRPGFRKVDTDRWEFANEGFIRGKKQLLKNIHRRKSALGLQIGSYGVSPAADLGRPGLDSEIKKLRKDRNQLMQELAQLQQEQRGRAHQVEAMKQRMETAEQRQKQMVSFLAKVLQNPAFLARLQQMKEVRQIGSPRVKRKFFKQREIERTMPDTSMEGQIVKYELDFGDTATTFQDIDAAGEQFPNHFLQDMVGKLDIGAIVEADIATGELEKEIVSVTKQMEMGGSSSGSQAYHDAFAKGKNVVSPLPEVDTEYLLSSFPEELSKKKMPDFVPPGVEQIKQEDVWSMGFDSSFGMVSSCHDVWDSFANYEDQEIGISGGLSNLWELGMPQNALGGSGTDTWPGHDSSSDNLES
ncbi:hypothetical protein Syun_000560 [Stephania yunnanensis]|uniref:Uncharacterized protein n=1 Tax=Stephania yunnanensis TaxID=152371 RepID=A0AAP0LF13_9MAGN